MLFYCGNEEGAGEGIEMVFRSVLFFLSFSRALGFPEAGVASDVAAAASAAVAVVV